MANRYFTQFIRSLAKDPVFLFGRVTFGAAGAPTLDAVNSKGIRSITRTAAGRYTVLLGTIAQLDNYPRLFNVKGVFLKATAAVAPHMQLISEQVVSTTAPGFVIQFYAPDGTTATDPAAGEEYRFQVVLTNSTAP